MRTLMIFGMLSGVFFAAGLQAQPPYSAYTKHGTPAQSCQGQQMSGAWMTAGTWGGSPGIELPPGDDREWDGTRIVLNHDIIICNNYDIDLRDSNLDTLIFKSGSSLHFRANGALLLPEHTVIIMEENTEFFTSNNSQGTLLMMGQDSIWGQQIRCIPAITGPRTITDTSVLCREEAPLPVELLSFTVSGGNGQAILEWATASEAGSAYFEIQRSADAVHWEVLGQVVAAGWSRQVIQYDFADAELPGGDVYYRIRQADTDGSSAYFPVVVYKGPPPGSLDLSFYNPVSAAMLLDYNWNGEVPTDIRISVWNLSGERMAAHEEHALGGFRMLEIPLEHVPPGMYIVTAENNGQIVTSERMIKLD